LEIDLFITLGDFSFAVLFMTFLKKLFPFITYNLQSVIKYFPYNSLNFRPVSSFYLPDLYCF